MATVLIVDEAGEDTGRLASALRSYGLAVRLADSANTAMQVFNSVRCQCVVIYIGPASVDLIGAAAQMTNVERGHSFEIIFIIGPGVRNPVIAGETARALKPAEVFYGPVEAKSLAAYISRLVS